MKAVEYLVQQGADIHATEAEAFQDAINENRPETVRQFLALGADPTVNGNEPLIKACKKGRTEIAGILLDSGAFDCHAVDDGLSWSSLNGHLETVQMLARRGADPFGIVLNLALFDKHEEVANFLTEIRTVEVADFLADMNAQPDFKKWLRQKYKQTDEVPLVRAFKMKCFDVLTAKMISAGEGLTLEDISKFRTRGNKDTLLELARRDGQLEKILVPGLWRGRLNDMQAVWQQLIEEKKNLQNVDFTSIVTAYHMMMLKENRPKKILKGPKTG